ncbi:MAG: phosphoribosylamine--glycine ligase [Candidatus Thermoplasmatota archaeon]|nr:phosphoribosylamine--glycine ligase [Candidatus Thermoplasmatota archaeon]MEC8955330.1 phosphoribosylamine--glycine ligase [Candidatus Thermoplasmatota archaeon]MEC9351495.1 phosphoribosylamine--glycine ligase [Candidatus Thermoplasmatota archaeon]MEC9477672.1 phosphoribosylamine--glycine ligase [Candidatus Thermoplasmatota archaeon]MED6313172.1 phosphoribosylamine--glycine ligase [Candidatus Thermoplasmatota archaeon]
MAGMKVLVVGGGGREHALAIGLSESNSVDSIHTCPGNAGTSMVGINHNVSATDVDGVVALASELSVDLVVVGPEAPLVAGLSDSLREKGIPSFGPHSEGAELEGSKLHAKRVMESLGIPTGGVQILRADSDIDAALARYSPPWVIKRDVLAAGKGVVVTEDVEDARSFIEDSISTDGFVLLEEFLTGEEASMLVIMDESGFICLPASQDHKRVGEGDTGPNTGGMGAYAPAPVVTPTVRQRVIEQIVNPMHHHLRNQPTPYRGVLYVGLMIDEEGAPSVVEYNVRFGDPETQVTIPLIDSDLGLILLAAAEGRISGIEPVFSKRSAVTVVLASEGYPGPSKTGRRISGEETRIEEGEITAFIHQAGTVRDDDGILLSNGGRVLSATAIANNLPSAVGAAYAVIDEIQLDGSHYRRDIAYRAL